VKKILVSIAAVMVAAVTAYAGSAKSIKPMACDAMGQWYVAAYGGASLAQSGVNSSGDFGGFAFGLDQSKKIGWDAGLKVGYDFAPKCFVRPVVEFDAFYNSVNRNFGVNTAYPGWAFRNGSATSKNTAFAFMVNALAKFNYGAWQPYAGAGLGWYHLRTKVDIASQGRFAINGSDKVNQNGFAWALMAGTDYKLTCNWALFAEYKWLNYQVKKDKIVPGVTKGRIGQQLVNLGVRYTF